MFAARVVMVCGLTACGYEHHRTGSLPDDGVDADATTNDAAAGLTEPDSQSDPSTCAAREEAECVREHGCYPQTGRQILERSGAVCLGERIFVGCSHDSACGDQMTAACPRGTRTATIVMPTTCVPEGFEPCDPPTWDMSPCP